MLAPLRLSALGFGAVAIGAVFLCSAALEAVEQRRSSVTPPTGCGPIVPLRRRPRRVDRRRGRSCPGRTGPYVLALLVVCAGLAFGTFFTPGMTLLSNAGRVARAHYGYAAALINLAVGARAGARRRRGRRARAARRRDAVPYLAALRASASLTLVVLLWRAAPAGLA